MAPSRWFRFTDDIVIRVASDRIIAMVRSVAWNLSLNIPPVISHALLKWNAGKRKSAAALQPDKLERAFGGDEDGFYARILFAWTSPPNYFPLANDVPEVGSEISRGADASHPTA